MKLQFPQLPTGFSKEDFDNFLIALSELNVSDIRIQSGDQLYAFVYGRKIPATNRALQHNELAMLATNMYGDNATSLLGGGTDLDFKYPVQVGRGKGINFRVNATSCYINGNDDAISITMRFLPGIPRTLDSLNLPKILARRLLKFSQGLVVVAGTTGSGKSTLLAADIREILETTADECINTYESPIEYTYDGIDMKCPMPSQVEIGKHLPTFAAGVRNAMRRAPSIILIGEARDKETIEASVEAALTGHKCYTTTHTDTAGGVVSRMLSAFSGEEQLLMKDKLISTLEVVVIQKLLVTKTGRAPAREWLHFTTEMKEAILLSSEPANVIINRMCRENGTSMQHYCKYLFDLGEVELKVAAMGANMHPDDFVKVTANHDLFLPYRREEVGE